MKNKDEYGSPTPVEQRFKNWIYRFRTFGQNAEASDGTQYRILPSGAYIRVTKKNTSSQRSRRRLMGKIRRTAGLTRSQHDKINNAA